MRGFAGVRQCVDLLDERRGRLGESQSSGGTASAGLGDRGFSQGATCSLQIGANHPDLFGTIIPTGSELKPTNGSESSMISRFFHGDRTAYEKQIPINAIRNHAPSNQTLVIGAGERDRESVRNVERIAPVAQQAGMHVTAVESLDNAHDWHAVQDTLRYGLAVFGYNTGLSDAKPKLVDYPNLKRISI